MTPHASRIVVLAAGLSLAAAWPVRAGVAVDFGTSWDGPSATLQSIIDARYGAGRIPFITSYLGARPSDPDPFFWVDRGFSALLVREIAGNANRNIVGWYIEPEDGTRPVIDGVDDGIVFDGPAGPGATAVITFNRPSQHFGFYLNPNGRGDAINAPEPETFFTNRFFDDLGPDGRIALHAPTDGDVQALIFDVSPWTQPNTWLVCFEDVDSGATPGPCCATTDNDFNDFVFEVTALSVTPTQIMSLGALKIRYR